MKANRACKHRFIIRVGGNAFREQWLRECYPNPEKWIKCAKCHQTYYDQQVIQTDLAGLKSAAREIVQADKAEVAIANLRQDKSDRADLLLAHICLEVRRQQSRTLSL